MQKIYKLIYLILASCVIILKRAKTKYLSKYLFKYLYYLFINKDLSNNKLNLSKDTKLYKKFFDTKINKLNISKNKEDNKIVKNYILLRQQLKL